MRTVTILYIFILLPLYVLAQKPIQVVCVGNSITEGFSNTSTIKAWPAQLNKLLGKEYAVYNCDVSGTTMFKLSDSPYWKTDRFEKAKKLNPQILILALGTNDADPWRWNSLKDHFKSDYLDMVKEFRKDNKDPIIYLCFPPPLFGDSKKDQNNVVREELIPLLKEIAEEIGASIIDFNTPLINNHKELPDNVHPEDPGALLMARIAYGKIRPIQDKSSSISVKNAKIKDKTIITADRGTTITLTPQAREGAWQWQGPNGFSLHNRQLILTNIKTGGVFTCEYTSPSGTRSVHNYVISVNGGKVSKITEYVQTRNGSVVNSNKVTVNPGGLITLIPELQKEEDVEGAWTWTGPNHLYASSRKLELSTITSKQAGNYIVSYTDRDGNISSSKFRIIVEGEKECPQLTSYMNKNNTWENRSTIELKVGEQVTFGPHPFNGKWQWKGPNNFKSERRETTISDFNETKAGQYIGTFTNEVGCKVELTVILKLKGK